MQRVNCGGVVCRPWLNVPLCRWALFSVVLRRLVFLSVVGIGRRVSSSVLEMHAVDANTSRRANGELNTRAVEWHMWQRRRRRRRCHMCHSTARVFSSPFARRLVFASTACISNTLLLTRRPIPTTLRKTSLRRTTLNSAQRHNGTFSHGRQTTPPQFTRCMTLAL